MSAFRMSAVRSSRRAKLARPRHNKRLQLTPNISLQSIRGTVLAAGAVPQRWRSALLGAAEPHIRYTASIGGVEMALISTAAPQFLVRKLSDALAFYEERLGFEREFVYADSYASVSRDGAAIHLKCAPKLEEERAHRKASEHLDAYLAVSGIQELHDELIGRSAPIVKPLKERPWGTRDFYVEDPDGYILCFAEAA